LEISGERKNNAEGMEWSTNRRDKGWQAIGVMIETIGL
jgi:hypothetical protein